MYSLYCSLKEKSHLRKRFHKKGCFAVAEKEGFSNISTPLVVHLRYTKTMQRSQERQTQNYVDHTILYLCTHTHVYDLNACRESDTIMRTQFRHQNKVGIITFN